MIDSHREKERSEVLEAIELLEERGWIVEDFDVDHGEYEPLYLTIDAIYKG